MEFLLSIDRAIFFAINQLPHTILTDKTALFFSFVGGNAIIWIVLAAILFFREERKDHWFILPVALAGLGSWLVSTVLLKPLFGRIRPYVFNAAILVDTSADTYSFPSSHATIAWAFALVLAREEPRWRWGLFALAALISLSRIYLGVHYPSDVIAGTMLGLCIGHAATEISCRMKT